MCLSANLQTKNFDFFDLCEISHKSKNFICQIKVLKPEVTTHSEKLLTLFLKFCLLFILGYAGSSLMRAGFSRCSKQGLPSSCSAQASHCGGFSFCRAQDSRTRRPPELWHVGSRVPAQHLQGTGLFALRHVGSSQTRD